MTADPAVDRRRLDAGGTTIDVLTIATARPGPVVTVFGGVHGDELEGVTASRMVAGRATGSLIAGELRIVAIANPLAFAARTRTSPTDGGNLARCFPGRVDGSDTERIAAALTDHVIAGSDLLIDLHSAGVAYSMPVFVGCAGGDDPVSVRSVEAATAFGAPLGWLHEVMNPGRSLSAALALDVPGIYVEGGGGGSLVRDEVRIYVEGVENVLGRLGSIHPQRPPTGPTKRWITGGDGDVDASLSATSDGWCVTAVAAGDPVEEGDLLAEIIDQRAEVIERIVAPRAATVMMLRRRAEVSAGDGIAMLGPPAVDRP